MIKKQTAPKATQRTVSTMLTNKIAVYKLVHENLDYISLIQRGFELRKKRNPRYSLRKYARDLELTPMHLSYILRGQRGLSRKKAEVIAGVLKLSFADRIKFLRIVSALSARSFKTLEKIPAVGHRAN